MFGNIFRFKQKRVPMHMKSNAVFLANRFYFCISILGERRVITIDVHCFNPLQQQTGNNIRRLPFKNK